MRLAVSNIAWPSGEDDAAASILIEHGAEGVEVAPTKVWPDPLEADPSDVIAYRHTWERRGLRVVAMQALLFGHPELTIFDDPATRGRTKEYLRGMIDLAALLGAGAMVFGSPKNRLAGELSKEEAEAIAVPFFRELGDHAAKLGVSFCIEPNPVDYGCDYVSTAAEGLELVDRVDSEGFGLHLDAAGMLLAGDPAGASIVRAAPRLRHVHASEPYLGPIGPGKVDHSGIAGALGEIGYDRWLSIEMKQAGEWPAWRSALAGSVRFVADRYGIADRAPERRAKSA
jgi:D-psicose/D-tagatose/L-ribulose 3-epimerase